MNQNMGSTPVSPMGQMRSPMDGGSPSMMTLNRGGGGSGGGGGVVGGGGGIAPGNNSSSTAQQQQYLSHGEPPYDLNSATASSMYNNSIMDPSRVSAHGKT